MKIDNTIALMSTSSPNVNTLYKSKNNNDALLKEQTNQFEAVILKTLLDKSLKSENHLFPKSPGEDIYKSMYTDALSKKLSGGFGFSELLFNFLKQNN